MITTNFYKKWEKTIMSISNRWKPNYKFQIKSTVQIESRKAYIKSLVELGEL